MANYKFMVGDHLVMTRDDWFKKDTRVDVVKVDVNNSKMPYFCSDGERHLWIDEDSMAPASEPALEVGQIYRVGKLPGRREWEGSIIKPKNLALNRFGAVSIRGEAPFDFMTGSPYADSLTLLTGPQVGEAIKKYDAEHAEKKAEGSGEYTEVNRKANVGEKIKIVHAVLNGSHYDNGDIGTVVGIDRRDDRGDARVKFESGNTAFVYRSEWVVLEPKPGVKEVKRAARVGEYIKVIKIGPFVCHDKKVGDIFLVDGKEERPDKDGFIWGCGLMHDMYVVLEGYSPVKEIKRRAKVGDTVRVLADNGGPVNAGTVWKVHSIRDVGTLVVHNYANKKPIWLIKGDNYVVLSSDKHVYTEAEIAEAKAFVLDTIRYLAEKDETVILSHSSGDENDNGAFCCYILGHDTLVDAGEDTFQASVVRYNSMCSDNDEPNEWVGKAVALCKALHKPLPSYAL